MLVVAEPDAVQDQRIEPVDHHPQGIGGQGTAPECRAAVHILDQQPQQYAEDNHGRHFLDIKRYSTRLIARIHQSQLITTLDNGRRIVENDLNRIPGHQKNEQREYGAGNE